MASGTNIPLDKSQADVLVLTTAVEVRLFPEAIGATAKIMNRCGADWTISTAAFEAANLGLISGDRDTRRGALRRIAAQASKCGAKTIVVPESGHAYQALRWESANELDEALPFEVLAISEFMAARIKSGELVLHNASDLSSVTYHDQKARGQTLPMFTVVGHRTAGTARG